MSNSRKIFSEKATFDVAASELIHRFTPDRGADTWQLRLFWTGGAGGSMKFETLDEDGNETNDVIEIDGSPFDQTSGDVEVTLDSANKTLLATVSGGTGEATVKCKAWRVIDATNVGYPTALTATAS